MTADSKYAELRVKHLEMVQSVIARLANQGAALRSYCITLVTGIIGVAITLQSAPVAALAALPALAFAFLDAQYLKNERRYRAMFDVIRADEWTSMPTFSLNLAEAPSVSLTSTFFAAGTIMFYLPVIISAVAVSAVLGVIYGWSV
jgi:hypothetical protein